MKSKFDFYEIVKVISKKNSLKEIYGVEAPVLGKAEEYGRWYYGIFLPDGVWDVDEDDVVSTGKFANPEDHRSVGSVRVRVKPDGLGEVIEDE